MGTYLGNAMSKETEFAKVKCQLINIFNVDNRQNGTNRTLAYRKPKFFN